MFENIVLGIIANFLTDFIKKFVAVSPPETPPTMGDPQAIEAHPMSPQSIQERRRYNQERRDAAVAMLTMALYLLVLLGAATMLPLLLKTLGGVLVLGTTRIPIAYEVNIYPLALILIAVLYLPSFYIVQKITQCVIDHVRSEWSDVNRSRAVRFFIGCCFIWLPLYAGMLCYWLFPSLGPWEAFGYPIGGVIAMFVFAYSRR